LKINNTKLWAVTLGNKIFYKWYGFNQSGSPHVYLDGRIIFEILLTWRARKPLN